MAETGNVNTRWTWRGPVILVVTILLAGALLEGSESEQAGEWVLRGVMVVGLLATAAYVVLVYLPTRRAAIELAQLQASCSTQHKALREMLANLRRGDLVAVGQPDQALAEDLQTEIGEAGRAVAALIQQIQSSSVEVATAATTVHRVSSELASASSQQAAAVVQITATTEELARTAGQIASNAAGQAELATESENAGDVGAQSVEAAVSGVEAVRQHVEAISGRADTLGSRAREIYRILDLITEIAQETHILALNAAIEAATAGEHGERFSVVAEEVRRLAERSRESVDSVRAHLDEFAGAIRGVVVATEGGSKAAQQVLEQSRAAQGSISQLRGALSKTAQASREISLATEEQRGASDQVVQTLHEVRQAVERIAFGLKRYTAAADTLNQLALSIQLLTQSFRIESKHSLKHELSHWADRLRDVSGNLEATQGVLEDLAEACPFLELVYLVDTSGIMIAYVVNRALIGDSQLPGEVATGQSYADRTWFQAVARDHEAIVTPIYESLLTATSCFTIAVAVLGGEGRMLGTLGVDVNLANWTSI
ncbi:MAG: methyl-accepting chemotaxis protein [Holophagae bacterium]|jgi:methyl-accepting chemotaxis protein